MKKALFLGAMAAMLLGTASCSKDMEPAMTDDGTVQFTIELPGNVDSRAISDGMTANKLTVAVYDAQGNEITDLKVLNKAIPHETTVQFKLVKGQTYSFAFWAQADGAPYTFSTADKSVSVSYENATCNDETRDAFYAYKTLTVDGPINQTVYLTRPFAQLNFGADDLAAAKIAHIEPSKSYIYVSSAATSFNLETGVATGETPVEVEFDFADLPDATVDNEGNITPATLTVDGKNYAWMGMSYFLVPDNQANISTALVIEPKVGEQIDIPVDNVPVKKNHRTNIVGSLFTEDANFNVVVDQNFDVADYNIDYNAPVVPAGKANVNGTEYNTIADALAVANGNTIYLGEGTYNETINVPANGDVSISAGKGLSADDVIINNQVYANPGSTLKMKDVAVTKSGAAAIVTEGATATLDGVEASGTRGISIEDGSTVTIKNSKFNGIGGDVQGYNRGVSIWGENNNVTIEASEMNAGWYGLNIAGGDGNEINLENVTINAWGCFNIWYDNQTITVNNCTLNSLNDKVYDAEGWNNFAAIKFNDETTNNAVNITNSTINVESTTGNQQFVTWVGGTNHKIYARSTNIVGKTTNTADPIGVQEEAVATFIFDIDQTVTCTWNGITYNFND